MSYTEIFTIIKTTRRVVNFFDVGGSYGCAPPPLAPPSGGGGFLEVRGFLEEWGILGGVGDSWR